jgi:hypothetical protein
MKEEEMGWTAGVRLPAEIRNCSLLLSVQTSFGTRPVSYLVETEVEAHC